MDKSMEELEAARAEALEKDQCFSKGRLRDEFRMKPKPDAEPVTFYKNGYVRDSLSRGDGRGLP